MRTKLSPLDPRPPQAQHGAMKEGPDISRIGAMLGDPARANMLMALMSGKALSAGELAFEAGITPATASGHLRQLQQSGLLEQRKQGRHRYFSLAGQDVGQALEALMGLAAAKGHLRSRTGPRDPALRGARVCYDHLAGAAGVRMLDHLTCSGLVAISAQGISLTDAGRDWADDFGIDLARLDSARRPLCRTCLDWSERRDHLAGSFGAALLSRLYATGWARRLPDSRVVDFTASGRAAFDTAFPTA